MAQGGLIRTAGSALAVFWFVFLFTAAILVASVTLSASQLQSRLLALSRADTPVSVWQIERVRHAWNAQQEAVQLQLTRVSGLRADAEKHEADLQEISVMSTGSSSRFQGSRSALVAKLRLYVPQFVGDDFERLDDQTLRALIEKAIGDISPALLPPTKRTVDELYDAYQQDLRNVQDDQRSLQVAYAENAEAAKTLEKEESELTAAQSQLNSIIDPTGRLSPADTARIYDLISEFTFIEQFALGALYKFSVLPNDFLSIVLVVTMGVLGSTLQLTYDYYRSAGVTQTSLFFLRPMLGAITALVVFILLKAGVLVVTDSAKLGEAAPLSPFFIAFVGIVSGLLSENALDTIRRTGQSWFRSSDNASEARWAVDIEASLPDGKTVGDLAAKTGLDAGELGQWIAAKAPTPADVQKVIAAWLDRDRRTLFSDLPPQQPEAP